jgi:hypothetical protein
MGNMTDQASTLSQTPGVHVENAGDRRIVTDQDGVEHVFLPDGTELKPDGSKVKVSDDHTLTTKADGSTIEETAFSTTTRDASGKVVNIERPFFMDALIGVSSAAVGLGAGAMFLDEKGALSGDSPGGFLNDAVSIFGGHLLKAAPHAPSRSPGIAPSQAYGNTL